jgi:aldehyde:ferredoxin oxidoreductase
MNIWRINVREQACEISPIPEAWEGLGGRGLIARIMVDEVPGNCEPLGRYNKLIFSPGLFVGYGLSSCDRISIGGKSPLTLGIKEANAGGTTGLKLVTLGIRALIIENAPEEPGWWVLHISKERIRFDRADDLFGKGVDETTQLLLKRYGGLLAAALIGPAGEMGLASAGIQNLDKDNVPSRIAARGGLGAVMGSKGLKAIVFDSTGGENPPIYNADAFKIARKSFTEALVNHPQTTAYRNYGTPAMAQMCNTFGALPTRNFSSGQFEDVEAISGEHMCDLLLERGGESKTTHACMVGCSIRCSNTFGGQDGKSIVSPLEYETIGLMGPNLGIASLDTIALMNQKANNLGLDTIELGAALGVLADAGLMTFGDGERALALIDEISQGTPLGRILGSGATITGRVFNVQRIPAVKGQAMSAYDPRAIKGTGVTYATSPQGADHTSGLTIRAKINHLDPKGQVEASRNAQYNMAGYDTLGACVFTGFGFGASPESIRDLLQAIYNCQADTGILQKLGKTTILLEREFNKKAGFTREHDRIPEWMTEEPLSPHNAVFDIPTEEMDKIFE